MIPEALLAPVQFVLDRGVAESTSAAALCARLEGKNLLMRPTAEGLSTYFVINGGRLLLKSGMPESIDAEVTGSLLSLMRLATDDPQNVIRQGTVHVSGDSDIVEDFQALLGFVRPDLEEELARVTGDPVAHEIGRATRSLFSWAIMARHSVARSLTEFLVEETRDLASVTELEEFCAEVDGVSLGVERAESKLQLLREQIALPANSDAVSE